MSVNENARKGSVRMRIEIEIPKEFEEHFNQDKFEDSLNRLYADVHLLAGNYERELAEMLIKAFRESKPAYDIDKVVAELESDDRHTFDGIPNSDEPLATICDALQEIQKYKYLEEQGSLLRLPVKPGDIVYIISTARRFHNEIIPLKVYGINIRKDDFTILAKNEKYCGYSISNLFGKHESVDWFLTKAEAEQRLKKMESD